MVVIADPSKRVEHLGDERALRLLAELHPDDRVAFQLDVQSSRPLPMAERQAVIIFPKICLYIFAPADPSKQLLKPW